MFDNHENRYQIAQNYFNRARELSSLSDKEKKERDAKNWAEIRQEMRSTKINIIINELDKLHEYGMTLYAHSDKTTQEKGTLIKNHALYMKDYIKTNNINNRFPDGFHQNFLSELNKHKNIINTHRDHGLKTIIANIILFCAGAFGVLYAPALALHYTLTDRGLFFSRTHSQTLIDQVSNRANYYKAPNYFRSTDEEIKSLEELGHSYSKPPEMSISSNVHGFP